MSATPRFLALLRKGQVRGTQALRVWGWLPLTIAIVSIVIWRSYALIINPELRAEDGAKVFAYFYEHRDFEALFRLKAGYLPLLPNLLGWLSVRLPARATPYFLTVVPTLLAATCACVLAAPAYRRYVPRDSVRYAICLGLAVAPVAGFLMTCNTDYSIWTALLLLMLLVLLPLPKGKLWSLLCASAISVLVWTHPLSILALPATLLWVWRDQRLFQRLTQASLVVSQGAHVWLGTEPHRATFAKGGAYVERFRELVTGIVDHVCREVVAPSIFPWLSGTPLTDYVFTGLFTLGMIACALLPKERVATRTLYAWVAYSIVVPMAAIVFVRADHGLYSQRYHYVSKAFTSIAWGLILSQLLISITTWSKKLSAFGSLPALGTLAFFTYLGISTQRYARFEHNAPDNGKIVHKFFADLADAERKQGGYCNIRLQCRKKHGDWPFVVDTRKVCTDKTW